MSVGKEIAERIIDSMRSQDDPKNRIITKVTAVYKEPFYQYVVDSNCNGFAEDTDKVLFQSVELYDDKKLQKFVGKTELELLKEFYESPINEFLKVLDALYKSNTETITDDDGCVYFSDSPLQDIAESFACGELITNGGGCNWDNINLLRNNGYDVYAGEKDSFGWLTGCIQKKGDARILVYG
jgi:hypothetical protein